MKTNWINEVKVNGYVFSHNLNERVTGPQSKNPGQQYISGSVRVATDKDALNIVDVYFTYVTPTYKSGKENSTYTNLKQIMTGATYENAGTNAMKVRIDGDVERNDFVSSRTGQMVEQKRVRGSFVHFDGVSIDSPATFKTDVIITNALPKEVENGEDYLELRGYAFNFRSELIPVVYQVRNAAGMKYFENQNISSSNPLLTNVWGEIVSTTIERTNEVESAWGAPAVKSTTTTLRSWNVTGSAVEPYDFGSEDIYTAEAFTAAYKAREEYLAQTMAEYNARKDYDNAIATPATQAVGSRVKTASSVADFKF